MSAPGGAALVEQLIGRITQDVADLPDRTSPEDQPDMMLVTGEELAAIIEQHATAIIALARRDALGEMAEVLRDHWLAEIICDHEAKTDTPRCACSLWKADPQPSVGAAVDAWIGHARALMEKKG